MQDDLAKMSLDELKEVAREKGLKGISKLRKSEILARLTESGEAVLPAEKNASEPKHTVKAKDNDKETEMKAENGAEVSAESGKKPERRKGSRTAVRTSHKADSSEERKEEQREEKREAANLVAEKADEQPEHSDAAENPMRQEASAAAEKTGEPAATRNPRRGHTMTFRPSGNNRTTYSRQEGRNSYSRSNNRNSENYEARSYRNNSDSQDSRNYRNNNDSQDNRNYRSNSDSQDSRNYRNNNDNQDNRNYRNNSDSQSYPNNGDSQDSRNYRYSDNGNSRGYRNNNDNQDSRNYRNNGGQDNRNGNRGSEIYDSRGYRNNDNQGYRNTNSDSQDNMGYRYGDNGDSRGYRGNNDSQDNRSYYREPERENDYMDDRNEGANQFPPGVEDISALDSGETAHGILEVMPEGYGFIRSENYMPGDNDIYVAPSQIRRFGMKTGDIVTGSIRIKTGNEKFAALLYVKSINGEHPSVAEHRKSFEDLTPIFPNSRLHLETSGGPVSMRIMDLLCPIGKGQRGMIVSPPKAGKTTLMKQVATAITQNHPDMHLILLLIDERPEEVTDIKESICGDNVEVIYSTFDELPEHHKRVAEMVLGRAKRLVEHGRDVVILLDSITRLSRAYNLTVASSGRTLSGGLDPAALYMPKKFFGSARNMREGGSLTILATALVDTGSRMDDVIFEEFKGTGNMEVVLDRKLSEKRVFPAIDPLKSGTRRDDLLLTKQEYDAVNRMRNLVSGKKPEESAEVIITEFCKTTTNTEFVHKIEKIHF